MPVGLERGLIWGSLVCDSCGPFSIRVGPPVSPPPYVQHRFQRHPVSLKGESVLPQFDWVESLYVALLNIVISMAFHRCMATHDLVIRPEAESMFLWQEL